MQPAERDTGDETSTSIGGSESADSPKTRKRHLWAYDGKDGLLLAGGVWLMAMACLVWFYLGLDDWADPGEILWFLVLLPVLYRRKRPLFPRPLKTAALWRLVSVLGLLMVFAGAGASLISVIGIYNGYVNDENREAATSSSPSLTPERIDSIVHEALTESGATTITEQEQAALREQGVRIIDVTDQIPQARDIAAAPAHIEPSAPRLPKRQIKILVFGLVLILLGSWVIERRFLPQASTP